MIRFRIALGIAALALGVSAPAQPWGPEFRVNSVTSGTQWYPSVANISDTSFVVVWEGPDQIEARILPIGAGSPGADFEVSTIPAGFSPAVGSDAAGNFVVTWTTNTDTSGRGVDARRFNFSGVAQTAEFRVNTYTSGEQGTPDVATFGSGRFVISWRDYLGQVSNPDVKSQLFASTGAPLGEEFRVNTVTTERQNALTVAGAPNKGFVVAWQDGSSGFFKILAQRFDPTGAPVGDAFRVNTYTSESQLSPRAASDPAGNFVVVWESSYRDGNLRGVYAQRFDAAGLPLGPEFRVNTYTTGRQWRASVAADISGTFLVAWESAQQDGSSYGIFAQQFDGSGSPRGPELRVNTYTSSNQRSVSATAVGRTFVVVWHSNEQGVSGYNVYGRRFCFKGDVDGNGLLNVSDVLYMINRLFAAGPPPVVPCPDVNGDDAFNVSDVLYLINHLFAGGPPPV